MPSKSVDTGQNRSRAAPNNREMWTQTFREIRDGGCRGPVLTCEYHDS